jgi:WD40 repeat protein
MKRLLPCLIVIIAASASVFGSAAQSDLPPEPIYDAIGLEPVMRIGIGRPNDIAWSPDGQTLAVATSIGIWLYDAEDLSAEPVMLNDTVFSAADVAYSADGSMIAAGGSEVHVWRTASREKVLSIDDPDNVVSVALSPDGRKLVVGFGFGTYDLYVWDIASGRQTAVLDEGVYDNLTFNADGTLLAAIRLGDCCFSMYLWDFESGQRLFGGDVTSSTDEDRVAFSPDGKLLFVTDRSGSFVVWDHQSRAATANISLDVELEEWYPAVAAVTADGTLFIQLSSTGIMRTWETGSFELTNTIDLQWNARDATLSPDGLQLAAVDPTGNLGIWEIASGALIAQRDNVLVHDPVMAFSPDGSLLAVAVFPYDIWLWNLADRKVIAILSGHEGQIMSVDFSQDGTMLASASQDRTVRLWDVTSGELIKIFVRREHPINTAIFDDEQRLLVADDDGIIQIYDLASGEPVELFYDVETSSLTDRLDVDCTYACIRDIGYTGSQLAVAVDYEVYHWALSKRGPDQLTVVTAHLTHLYPHSLVLSEDSLIYGGMNGVVLRWGYQQATEILTTHQSWIYSLASWQGGLYTIASAGCSETGSSPWDGSPSCGGASLRLWSDSKQGQSPPEEMNVSQAHGHTSPVTELAFSPDGTTLASISEDGTLLLWENSSPE